MPLPMILIWIEALKLFERPVLSKKNLYLIYVCHSTAIDLS